MHVTGLCPLRLEALSSVGVVESAGGRHGVEALLEAQEDAWRSTSSSARCYACDADFSPPPPQPSPLSAPYSPPSVLLSTPKTPFSDDSENELTARTLRARTGTRAGEEARQGWAAKGSPVRAGLLLSSSDPSSPARSAQPAQQQPQLDSVVVLAAVGQLAAAVAAAAPLGQKEPAVEVTEGPRQDAANTPTRPRSSAHLAAASPTEAAAAAAAGPSAVAGVATLTGYSGVTGHPADKAAGEVTEEEEEEEDEKHIRTGSGAARPDRRGRRPRALARYSLPPSRSIHALFNPQASALIFARGIVRVRRRRTAGKPTAALCNYPRCECVLRATCRRRSLTPLIPKTPLTPLIPLTPLNPTML
eukprot:g37804.t1